MNRVKRCVHKNLDISNLKNTAKKLTIPILSTTLSLCLFSGCSLNKDTKEEIIEQETIENINDEEKNKEDNYVVTEENIDELVDIPEIYMGAVNYDNSIRNLSSLNYLCLTIKDDSDLSWVNYCNNMSDLVVFIHNDGKSLDSIKSLKNLKNIYLNFMESDIDKKYNDNYFSFIKNSNNISNLTIIEQDTDFTNHFIEIAKNSPSIETLNINFNSNNYKIDFNNIDNIKELNLGSSGIYDLAVTLDNETIANLKNKGINIKLDNGTIEDVININNKLDSIVNSLGVTKKSGNEDKIKAILIYILDNYEYDEEIRTLTAADMSCSNLVKQFYEEGNLFAVFNKNGNLICGNYSALFQALANRLDVDSYVINSKNHSWNMVCVDDEYYYIDATWIDGTTFSVINYDVTTQTSTEENFSSADKIRKGETDEIDWYMLNPNLVSNYDNEKESHVPENFPTSINIQPYNDEENLKEEFSLKKFIVSIDKKVWIISGSALVGLLLGLGLAIKVKSKKRYNNSPYNMYNENNSYDIYNSSDVYDLYHRSK